MSVYDASLEPIARTLVDGRESPLEYIDHVLARIDAVEPDVQSLVEEADRDARLRRAARALEAEYDSWNRPPLYGVPVGVKDIFHVDGLATRAGSDMPPATLAGPESSLVSTLKNAGAIILGKTVTTEFAYFDPGPTRNPHALEYTPGGSSSGSAAAVAAGICPLALGTQTAGSTMRPAAFCGIVGFKPSLGRLPTDGLLPFSESADHVGLFTQDVSGMQRAASVVCPEWRGVEVDAPVLGVPEGPYIEQADQEALAAFERQVEELADAGFEVQHVDALPDIDEVNERHMDLITAEAALVHHHLYESHADRYREQMVELLETGGTIEASRIAEGRTGQQTLRERLTDTMDDHGIDIWLSPAAPGPAPEGIDDTGDPVMNIPWTHSGVPTVSLPAGVVDGRPVGLQCASRSGSDERLLEWSKEIRGVFDSEL